MAITVRNNETIEKLDELVKKDLAGSKTKMIDVMAEEYEELLECREELKILKGALNAISSVMQDEKDF
mgnify:CR=1 FL=1